MHAMVRAAVVAVFVFLQAAADTTPAPAPRPSPRPTYRRTEAPTNSPTGLQGTMRPVAGFVAVTGTLQLWAGGAAIDVASGGDRSEHVIIHVHPGALVAAKLYRQPLAPRTRPHGGLVLKLEDGTVSSRRWRCTAAPQSPGWIHDDFDDSGWRHAVRQPAPNWAPGNIFVGADWIYTAEPLTDDIVYCRGRTDGWRTENADPPRIGWSLDIGSFFLGFVVISIFVLIFMTLVKVVVLAEREERYERAAEDDVSGGEGSSVGGDSDGSSKK